MRCHQIKRGGSGTRTRRILIFRPLALTQRSPPAIGIQRSKIKMSGVPRRRTLVRWLLTTVTRRVIMQTSILNLQRQKTCCSLDGLHFEDCSPPLEALERVPCINYPIFFQKDPLRNVSALIGSGSEAMPWVHPAFAKKLGLAIQKTEHGAQKIDGSTLWRRLGW